MNNEGSLVSTYTDGENHSHGLLRSRDGKFTTVDYPGSNYSELLGIDDREPSPAPMSTRRATITVSPLPEWQRGEL